MLNWRTGLIAALIAVSSWQPAYSQSRRTDLPAPLWTVVVIGFGTSRVSEDAALEKAREDFPKNLASEQALCDADRGAFQSMSDKSEG